MLCDWDHLLLIISTARLTVYKKQKTFNLGSFRVVALSHTFEPAEKNKHYSLEKAHHSDNTNSYLKNNQRFHRSQVVSYSSKFQVKLKGSCLQTRYCYGVQPFRGQNGGKLI